MNKEDIARMAHDAMIDIKDEFGNWIGCALDKEKFATLVAAHERDAASERAWKVLINKGADWSVRQMVSDAIKGERNDQG